jgi:hypothetical protein
MTRKKQALAELEKKRKVEEKQRRELLDKRKK